MTISVIRDDQYLPDSRYAYTVAKSGGGFLHAREDELTALRNLLNEMFPPAMSEVVADLEEVHKAVFGDVGDEPNVYADYDRCSELAGQMRRAIKTLAVSSDAMRACLKELSDYLEHHHHFASDRHKAQEMVKKARGILASVTIPKRGDFVSVNLGIVTDPETGTYKPVITEPPVIRKALEHAEPYPPIPNNISDSMRAFIQNYRTAKARGYI